MAPFQGVGASSILARDNNSYYIIFIFYYYRDKNPNSLLGDNFS